MPIWLIEARELREVDPVTSVNYNITTHIWLANRQVLVLNVKSINQRGNIYSVGSLFIHLDIPSLIFLGLMFGGLSCRVHFYNCNGPYGSPCSTGITIVSNIFDSVNLGD